MKIEYKLTKEDYIQYNLYYMDTSDTVRKSLFRQRYITSLVFLVFPFIMGLVSNIPLWYWLAVFILAYILWVAYYPRYFRSYSKKRIQKMMEEGKSEKLLGLHSMELTEEGITETTSYGVSKISWTMMERIDETDLYIYIFFNAFTAFVVPLRIFKSEDEKNEFLAIIKKHCKL